MKLYIDYFFFLQWTSNSPNSQSICYALLGFFHEICEVKLYGDIYLAGFMQAFIGF